MVGDSRIRDNRKNGAMVIITLGVRFIVFTIMGLQGMEAMESMRS